MAFSWKSTHEPDVRYVIIGNGFDVECGLKTSYKDFLKFVREGTANNVPSPTKPRYCVNWEELREHNCWFKRFDGVQIGDGWVDFENEIARVIKSVERSMTKQDGTRAFIDGNVSWANPMPLRKIDAGGHIKTYRMLAKKLLSDLESLTRGLEAYLYDYVCPMPPRMTDAITRLVNKLVENDNVYVISFNYTRTFEKILRERRFAHGICYVHGTLSDGSGKNSMVLGIDGRSDSNTDDSPVEFGPFRKYNQRIYKQTNGSYMDWLKDARYPHEQFIKYGQMGNQLLLSSPIESPEIRAAIRLREESAKKIPSNEVIIFGHSLGITDEDILKAFITLPNTRTVVYHHNEESFSNQVSNTTAILGADELIERTGGRDRTIEFRNQYDPS